MTRTPAFEGIFLRQGSVARAWQCAAWNGMKTRRIAIDIPKKREWSEIERFSLRGKRSSFDLGGFAGNPDYHPYVKGKCMCPNMAGRR